MTCPICAFPGNDPTAVRCTNCGFAMRPPPPNPEPEVVAAYDVYPISDAPPPYPTGGWQQVQPLSPMPVSAPLPYRRHRRRCTRRCRGNARGWPCRSP
ncbi:hypothetical protein OHA72_25285 [Dactylosporangium sp. NBC_01737]|uniref:hypothetical protein n=1 Tax=Dactylosporangium sp. NBC_01737 TaxID=2975959 RepID=UPI002E1148ED|nr:hypothetical protein OHA72_25285 [Dactylosporangium sp. NBC_01737]